jgi:ParB-like chromosome segregation protein Spo0J
MKTFGQYVESIKDEPATGQKAGKMELHNTSVEKAIPYAEKVFENEGAELSEQIPNFKANYKLAKKIVDKGHTLRKDMPVINDEDVRRFQARLAKGFLDVEKPLGDATDVKNPFPTGLKGASAKTFIEAGLKRHDKDSEDDKVKLKQGKVPLTKLKPIQKQIYIDKSIPLIAEYGASVSATFIKSQTFFIVSADNYIIDGHHRFLQAMLIDPKMSVNALIIDLPISKLLPLSLAYGDAIGNKRNQ